MPGMLATIYTAALTLAQSDGAGRGDNPSEAGGVLIVIGVILLAALVIGSACYLIARATARRRRGVKQGAGREG
jgi:hypothetical protein